MKNQSIPFEEKTKIMVAYDSNHSHSKRKFSDMKMNLLQSLRKEYIRIIKDESYYLEVDKVVYYFFDVAKRNIKEFAKKYKVNKIIALYLLKEEYIREELLQLLDNKNEYYNSNTIRIEDNELFAEYKALYPLIDVFMINQKENEIQKISIYEIDFDKNRYYRTEEEALNQLISIVENRIDYKESAIKSYTKQIADDKKLLSKLEKKKIK